MDSIIALGLVAVAGFGAYKLASGGGSSIIPLSGGGSSKIPAAAAHSLSPAAHPTGSPASKPLGTPTLRQQQVNQSKQMLYQNNPYYNQNNFGSGVVANDIVNLTNSNPNSTINVKTVSNGTQTGAVYSVNNNVVGGVNFTSMQSLTPQGAQSMQQSMNFSNLAGLNQISSNSNSNSNPFGFFGG